MKNVIEFEVGQEITVKPYDLSKKAIVKEVVLEEGEDVKYRVDIGLVDILTTGLCIVESQYYVQAEDKLAHKYPRRDGWR